MEVFEKIPLSGGSVEITADFTYPDGSEMTPDSANYTLTDVDGSIVNGRNEIALANLSPSIEFMVYGDDLPPSLSEVIVTTIGYYTWNGQSGIPQVQQKKLKIKARG